MSEKDVFVIRGVYEVGGHVRDQLLGLHFKDLDYQLFEDHQAIIAHMVLEKQ